MATKTESKIATPEPKIRVSDISERDPARGLPPSDVRVDDLSSIPGLLPHWIGEMNKRKKEIMEVKNASFTKKATRIFGGSASDTVTGAELLSIIDPNLKTNNSTKALNANPINCDERSHLISYILKRSVKLGREISLVHMRLLLLHAFLANMFEERSLQSLVTLYQVHLAYLDRVFARNEKTIREVLTTTIPKETQKKIHLNRNLLSVYKIFLSRRIPKLLPQIKQLSLDNKQLKNFDSSQSGADEKKNNMLRSAYYAVCIMRCFPLLKKETNEIADLVLKMDNDHPLGWFLKGHIIAAAGELKFDQDRAGYRPKGLKEAMINEIKEALENYGKALAAIPGNRYEGLNFNILAEYISFIIFVCRFIPAPRLWKETNLKKAMETLKSTDSTNAQRIIKMQNNIETVLNNL